MKTFLIQLIILALLSFSSASCLKVNINLPAEKPPANDSKPQVTPTPLNSPVVTEPVRSEPIEPLAENWQILLTSDGGIANDGAGNFFADATGKLTYQKPRMRDGLPPLCETKLNRQETGELKSLAADWRVPDEAGRNILKLDAVNDDVNYRMIISSGNAKYELEFHGSTIDSLPFPNKNLIETLFDLRAKACGESDQK